MTTSSLLLSLALLIIVVVYLARPFLMPALRPRSVQAFSTPSKKHPRLQNKQRELLVQKEAFLTQIEALDFDFETGKLPASIHQKQRAYLMQQAAGILQQIDETPIPTSADEIEAAIAKLRQPETTKSKAVRRAFCSQCGQAISANDKFCAGCGHQLGEMGNDR